MSKDNREECPDCKGTGKYYYDGYTYEEYRTCKKCNGTGKVTIDNNKNCCPICNNKGTYYQSNPDCATCGEVKHCEGAYGKTCSVESKCNCESIDSGADANGWISVEERLPEPYESVLSSDEKYPALDRVNESFHCGDKWHNIREDRYPRNITHWQPLPKPPITIKGE